MASPRSARALTILVLLATACSSAPSRPSTTAERTPNPGTVNRDDPAGDAQSPIDAALTRLLEQPVGTHSDKFRTLVVPLPDRPYWKRVRFIGYPTRVGFRYGDDHYAVVLIDYREAQGGDGPERCLASFAGHARGMAQKFDLEIGNVERHETLLSRGVERSGEQEDDEPMPVLRATGWFTTLTNRDRYVAAISSHSSWPGTCLVQGFAVHVGTDEELAHEVVSRYVRELAPRLRWAPTLRAAPPTQNR